MGKTAGVAWVLLVTDGLAIEFPPEFYRSPSLAHAEAEHWAWCLSSPGGFAVRRPFAGRWEVGIRDIRVIELSVRADIDANDAWVGTHWTRHGYPEPDGVFLESRQAARHWVESPPAPDSTSGALHEGEWMVSCTFGTGDREEESVAHRLKVVQV